MDRSLRRRGQLLAVVAALLGAVIGAALGLVVDDAETGRAVAAPGRAPGAALAASPPSSQPPAPEAASAGIWADGNDPSGRPLSESADRADRWDAKARKDRDGRRDKPEGHGKDKPGKGTDK